MAAATRRSVRDIRTMAGKVDRIAAPYRAYMQITALEMEKERKEAERRVCLERLDHIARRMAAIEEEKEALVRGLVGKGSLVVTPGPEPASSPQNVATPSRPSRIRHRG